MFSTLSGPFIFVGIHNQLMVINGERYFWKPDVYSNVIYQQPNIHHTVTVTNELEIASLVL